MSGFDVVFVGSSPNALAGAARLAKGGARVLVLETRPAVGGPVATESFAPGFSADAAVSSLALDPEIARDLDVSVETIRRESVTVLGSTPSTLRGQLALGKSFDDAVALLRAIHRMSPPDVPGAAAGLDAVGARLRGLGARAMHEVLRLSFMSIRDFVEERVEDGALRTALAGVGVRALTEGPFAAGTTFNLIHHSACDDALSRTTARGGVARVAEALAAAAKRAGVEIRTAALGPLRVVVEEERARGVALGDGTVIAAARVVSDLDARATFTKLVPAHVLLPEQNRAIRALRYRGAVARVHLALSSLPEIAGVDADALRGTLVVAGSVADLERAWDEAKRGALPESPYVEFTVPSLTDPSLAPEGKHVLDAWVQYVPYRRADRAEVARRVVAQIARHAPGLAQRVLHTHVSLPEDLEERFGLTEGQLYGGEIRLDQAFFLRPLPGHARYETPIAELYLAGSAAHPGGYTGRSGYNLAEALLSTKA